MRLSLLVVVLLLAGLADVSPADASDRSVADSPDQIRPLMIGAHIPDVTLSTPDHQPVALKDILARQPTILIYYRGGW